MTSQHAIHHSAGPRAEPGALHVRAPRHGRASSAAALPWAGVLGPGGLVQLQRTVGNAAVQRALLSTVLPPGLGAPPGSPGGLLEVQRASLLSAVGGACKVGGLARDGTPYCVIEEGVPAGFHVTIFPAFTEAQQGQIRELRRSRDGKHPSLSMITAYDEVTFSQFNVTKEDDANWHFYFNEAGVYWAKKEKEARLDSPDWPNAVVAAAFVYARIGIALTKDQLLEQLYVAGRPRPEVPVVAVDPSKLPVTMRPRVVRAMMNKPLAGRITKPTHVSANERAAKRAELLELVKASVATLPKGNREEPKDPDTEKT